MSDGTFYGYILLLIVSGITLSVLAARGFGQSIAFRALDGLFSVGFLGYACYLLFVFDGGQVTVLFYAFIVPVLAVVKVVRSRREQLTLQALGRHGAPVPAPSVAGQPVVASGDPEDSFGPPSQYGSVPTSPYAQPASQVPPGAAYSAPVLTRTIGEPLQSSPYGRHTPGQPIDFRPAPPSDAAAPAAAGQMPAQAPTLH
jgi:hypothetical protein